MSPGRESFLRRLHLNKKEMARLIEQLNSEIRNRPLLA